MDGDAHEAVSVHHSSAVPQRVNLHASSSVSRATAGIKEGRAGEGRSRVDTVT